MDTSDSMKAQVILKRHPILDKYVRKIPEGVQLKREDENRENERILCESLHITQQYEELKQNPDATSEYFNMLVDGRDEITCLLQQAKITFSNEDSLDDENLSPEEREKFLRRKEAWSIISWERFVHFLAANNLFGEKLWELAKTRAEECETNKQRFLKGLQQQMKEISLMDEKDLLKQIDKIEDGEGEPVDKSKVAEDIRSHYKESASRQYEMCKRENYDTTKDEKGDYGWNFVSAFVASIEQQRCNLLKQQFGMDMIQYIQEFYKVNKTPFQTILEDPEFSQSGSASDAFYTLFTKDLNLLWDKFGRHHPYVKTTMYENLPYHLSFVKEAEVCVLMTLFYIIASEHKYKTEEARYIECGNTLCASNMLQLFELTTKKFNEYCSFFDNLDNMHK